MNTDKFYQRTKLCNEILYEIFNVESNYRTELTALNSKLLKKIEEHKSEVNQKKIQKLYKFASNRNSNKNDDKNNPNSNRVSKTQSRLISNKEDNPMINKLISEGLEHLLDFYKEKQKVISKEVSDLGILIYNFSSSIKKYDNQEDLKKLNKFQEYFDTFFGKFMKTKKIYFEKMNKLELYLHEQENNKQVKDPKKNNEDEKNKLNTDSFEKEKIDELVELRRKYKNYLGQLAQAQKAYIAKISEIGNAIQEFNITENEILYGIFKILETNSTVYLKDISNRCLIYDNNKKLIEALNLELGNNLIYDSRIYLNYKFEEYTPKSKDINNQKDLSVIQKMNKLIGFEFGPMRTNKENDKRLNDNIVYDKDIDENLLFILLMDKFTGGEYVLNDKEKILLKNLFNQEKYIKEFLSKLNKIRMDKQLFNKKENFDILLECFNLIFSKINFYKEQSHELVKYIMILSETFCYKDENENKSFLINVADIPNDLKDTKFWINYIEIEVELESKKCKDKNTAYCAFIVLLSNTTHLKEYLSVKDKIKDIINYFQNKFKISSEEIDIIKEQLNI